MRFLLFNLVVAGALFYLFTADREDIRSVAGTAHATVNQVEDLAYTAVDTVNDFIDGNTGIQPPTVSELAAPDVIEPVVEKAVIADVPPVEAPEPAAVADTTVEAPEPAAVADTAVEDKKDDAGDIDEKIAKPVMVASSDLPVEEVAQRPVHPVPDPAKAIAAAQVADPAVAKRRAEVLGGIDSAAPAPATAGKGEIAIAEGETLMSPRQRGKELYNLAEDMELMFLNKTVE